MKDDVVILVFNGLGEFDGFEADSELADVLDLASNEIFEGVGWA